MTGIDVHPVAVHLARAAWTMAARSVMNAAGAAGFDSPMSIPVYLGDSLQLRFRTGDMFAEREIRIQTHDENNTELVFPVSLDYNDASSIWSVFDRKSLRGRQGHKAVERVGRLL